MNVGSNRINDKPFGLADAECRLLGCNFTAETERRETRWSLSAHFVGFNFGSHRVMISILEVDAVCVLTHCGRVTQICVFNTVKLGTSVSSP